MAPFDLEYDKWWAATESDAIIHLDIYGDGWLLLVVLGR
jgi:hypothetical protein